ncbi:hypothetical protein EZV62_011278 [Acer yangbiense]|uniref:RING-type E3 ubiquitin transferase n=1 Tax=Acer yangbiense TaxID=1000413 RepID=A0A5C7I5B7_9ROSI|nr:hypothetical protein EZV62_011278 [Acer yangbiense]
MSVRERSSEAHLHIERSRVFDRVTGKKWRNVSVVLKEGKAVPFKAFRNVRFSSNASAMRWDFDFIRYDFLEEASKKANQVKRMKVYGWPFWLKVASFGWRNWRVIGSSMGSSYMLGISDSHLLADEVIRILRRRDVSGVVKDGVTVDVLFVVQILESVGKGAVIKGCNRKGGIITLDLHVVFCQDFTHDRYSDMRLDIDNMSYEELLALEERVGDVKIGLTVESIMTLLKQRKYMSTEIKTPSNQEPFCVCQEEYGDGDDLGTLDCGHDFHTDCIKQWIMQKNLCPKCKKTALSTLRGL